MTLERESLPSFRITPSPNSIPEKQRQMFAAAEVRMVHSGGSPSRVPLDNCTRHMRWTLIFEQAVGCLFVRKLRTFLTVATISLGIMALVGVLTAIGSIRKSVSGSFSNLGVNKLMIAPPLPDAVSGKMLHPPITHLQLERLKETYQGYGTVSLQVNIAGNARVGRNGKATNPNTSALGVDEFYLESANVELEAGRNFTPREVTGGAPAAIIGHELLQKLFEPSENPIAKFVSVSGKRLQVIGILKKKGAVNRGNSQDRLIMMPLPLGRTLSGNDSSTDATVYFEDPRRMDEVAEGVVRRMRIIRGDRLRDEDSFQLLRSDSMARNLDRMENVLNIGGLVIGLITLLGASVGLLNNMLVNVADRVREIGLRKAVGARPRDIRNQFLFEVLLICQLGGLAGVVLGLAAGNIVSHKLGFEAFQIPWKWILLGILASQGVGLVAGYMPARRAARLDPVEALRDK